MYVCMHVRMYVVYVCMSFMYVCRLRMYVVYVCLYVCSFVSVCTTMILLMCLCIRWDSSRTCYFIRGRLALVGISPPKAPNVGHPGLLASGEGPLQSEGCAVPPTGQYGSSTRGHKFPLRSGLRPFVDDYVLKREGQGSPPRL